MVFAEGKMLGLIENQYKALGDANFRFLDSSTVGIGCNFYLSPPGMTDIFREIAEWVFYCQSVQRRILCSSVYHRFSNPTSYLVYLVFSLVPLQLSETPTLQLLFSFFWGISLTARSYLYSPFCPRGVSINSSRHSELNDWNLTWKGNTKFIQMQSFFITKQIQCCSIMKQIQSCCAIKEIQTCFIAK